MLNNITLKVQPLIFRDLATSVWSAASLIGGRLSVVLRESLLLSSKEIATSVITARDMALRYQLVYCRMQSKNSSNKALIPS